MSNPQREEEPQLQQEELDRLWLVQMEVRKIYDDIGIVTADNPMGEIGMSMASSEEEDTPQLQQQQNRSLKMTATTSPSSPGHVLSTLTSEEEALQTLISEKGTKYKSCVN